MTIKTTTPPSLRNRLHGNFFSFLIVIGIFGVWLYIILGKTMVEMQLIAWDIQSQRIIAQNKKIKNPKMLPSEETTETNAN